MSYFLWGVLEALGYSQSFWRTGIALLRGESFIAWNEGFWLVSIWMEEPRVMVLVQSHQGIKHFRRDGYWARWPHFCLIIYHNQLGYSLCRFCFRLALLKYRDLRLGFSLCSVNSSNAGQKSQSYVQLTAQYLWGAWVPFSFTWLEDSVLSKTKFPSHKVREDLKTNSTSKIDTDDSLLKLFESWGGIIA